MHCFFSDTFTLKKINNQGGSCWGQLRKNHYQERLGRPQNWSCFIGKILGTQVFGCNSCCAWLVGQPPYCPDWAAVAPKDLCAGEFSWWSSTTFANLLAFLFVLTWFLPQLPQQSSFIQIPELLFNGYVSEKKRCSIVRNLNLPSFAAVAWLLSQA